MWEFAAGAILGGVLGILIVGWVGLQAWNTMHKEHQAERIRDAVEAGERINEVRAQAAKSQVAWENKSQDTKCHHPWHDHTLARVVERCPSCGALGHVSRPEPEPGPRYGSRFDEDFQENKRRVKDRINDHINEKVQEELRRAAEDSFALSKTWQEELAFEPDDMGITRNRIKDRYRHLSKSRHPDNHGTAETYVRLNKAKEQAEKEVTE